MDKFPSYLAVLVGIIMVARAFYLIRKRAITPVFSTWLMFAVAASMSLASYLFSKNPNFMDNILNLIDVVALWTMVFALFVYNGGIAQLKFKRFEIYCLGGSGLITLFWILSRDSEATNLAVQVLLAIGYFPTIKKLWKASIQTESFFVWGAGFLLSVSSLYLPLHRGNSLAIIYAVRAASMSGFVLFLMWRIQMRVKKA